MTARVSVLMPVFNAAATLERAVISMVRQTLQDWELIVVDDGSTDETPRLMAQWARRDPRIRWVRRPHRGIVASLNQGLALARARHLARMDADDISTADRLEEQWSFLERNPDIGLVGCLVEFGGDRLRYAGYARHVDWINSLRNPIEIQLGRFVESPFAHPSVMFRSDLPAKHGNYRQGDFPEDYELWLRWLEAGVVMAKVPKVLLRWNDAPHRLSRRDPRYDLEAFYRCKAVYLARWLRREAGRRRFLVWGAGRLTRRRVGYLEKEGIRIDGYIDIDDRKIGRNYQGRLVFSPNEIPSPSDVFILGYVSKPNARELIRERLVKRGFAEGSDFLLAA
ncbi:MAG TPA: glycosyltransferase [Candidatus Paceibacterota bacterium]|nr:glycosyltransferase [Candidatus Paceibacterota bacterium]